MVIAAPLGLAAALALAACGSFSSDGAWIPAGHCTASKSMDVGGSSDSTTHAAAIESLRDYYAGRLESLPAESPSPAEFFEYDRDKLGIAVAGLDAALANVTEAEKDAESEPDTGWGAGVQVSAAGAAGTSGYVTIISADGGESYIVQGFSLTGPSASGTCP